MGLPLLRIRLLGELDLRHGEAPLPPLESARAGSLLAYLLLHRAAPQSRQHLAFLLWPESTEPQARTNLRHVLHTLRRGLPDPDRFLAVTPRTLQWRADGPFWLDVAAFEAALSRAEPGASEDLAVLRDGVELYTGELLEGCYDEWLLDERERLRQRYLDALERLTALLEARGQLAEAIPYAEQLLRHDPLREETYQLLMRLHDARGDRARALRVYHVCAATLERELGVGPAVPTREAYEALLRLEREPTGRPRQEVRAGRAGGPPLVGRAGEWAHLTSRWRETERGRAQLVLVSGEPGIGKTRLLEELGSWCVHRGAMTVEARSYAAESALAYGPLVAWLRSDALRPFLARLDHAHLTELARLLPELLSQVPGLLRPEPLPETEQRQRLFDAAARAIRAPDRPLLLVADDLQWCDRETLEFVHYLLRSDPEARLLVASTARLEEVDHGHPLQALLAGLHTLGRCAEITLGRLSREETTALARHFAGHALAAPDADQLYRETEGNPLFVVEALRAGWSSGHAESGWPSPRVQAVIESRLGQLSEPARTLLGLAATIGREFTTDVLARASQTDEDTLVQELDELWQRRLLRERGGDAYDFSHDLIREAAYLALSPMRRRQHHLRVARALEQIHAHDPRPVSGQLAAHYDRAGATSQAIHWYGRAADAALQLHAHPEAVRLLERALALLRALPETSERHARELELLAALPAALGWVHGFQSPRLVVVQRRALELARRLGSEPDPPVLRSLATASLSSNDFAGTRRFAWQLRARGERDADPVLEVEGEYLLGVAGFWLGEFAAAREHFEAAIARFRPEHRRTHLLRYAQDPEVICLNRLACTLWFQGYPEAASRACDRSLALAEEVGHPQTHSLALVFAALLSLEAREPDRLCTFEARFATFGGGFDRWHTEAHGEVLRGYVEVLDGGTASGAARIRRAIDAAPKVASAPGHGAIRQRVLLAACEVTGDSRTGLATADSLIAMGEAAGLWQAEAHRMRAEFLAAMNSSEQEIAAEFARALQIARGQGAQSLELRAAASLLSYRLRHGESSAVRDARNGLVALLERFSEGRDGHDLRLAADLLAKA